MLLILIKKQLFKNVLKYRFFENVDSSKEVGDCWRWGVWENMFTHRLQQGWIPRGQIFFIEIFLLSKISIFVENFVFFLSKNKSSKL